MSIKDDSEKLTRAFDHMVENVNQAIHDAEEALAPSVDEMVSNAQELAHEVFSLSKKESERLGKTLKRDIESANKILNQQRKELKDWLSFDLALVEDKFIELIARAADKTWLDFRDFENEERNASVYSAGEICSAGTLSCVQCSKTLKFTKSSHIPPCPDCQCSEFYRVVS